MSYEDRAFESLKRIERNYNIFKAVLIVLSTIVIVSTIVYTSNRLYENSSKNRELLRCTVVTITTDTNQSKFKNDLQNCLDRTK